MKKLFTTGALALLGAVINVTAQSNAPVTVIPNVINGQPFTVNGQTFFISTNASGGLEVTTLGTAGTNVMQVPTSPSQAMQVATAWIEANNPANKSYYGSNEWSGRVGAGYLQNSGQAIAVISVDKYGIFSPHVGLGAGVLQGNNGGKSGTAGGYGEVVYRQPIGDVAGVGGLMGGYDNWNHKGFVALKAGVEYRQSANLGEWLDAIYAFEGVKQDRGLILAAGISYSFDSFNKIVPGI